MLSEGQRSEGFLTALALPSHLLAFPLVRYPTEYGLALDKKETLKTLQEHCSYSEQEKNVLHNLTMCEGDGGICL